jgi:hypothetical protein
MRSLLLELDFLSKMWWLVIFSSSISFFLVVLIQEPINRFYDAVSRRFLPLGFGVQRQIVYGVIVGGCLCATFGCLQYDDIGIFNPFNQAFGFLILYAILILFSAMIFGVLYCIEPRSRSKWRIVYGMLGGSILFFIFIHASKMGNAYSLLFYFFPFIGFFSCCLEFFYFASIHINRWRKEQSLRK